ncbi:MAG: polysaccharide pyruvyl transferase CsaB [Thermoleophilia bacterium]
MRYLISGYYGEGNLGDEAILAGILQEVRARDAEAEFTVLSFAPEDTRRRHGVAAATTTLRDLERWRSLLRSHDILLSGGGSFLHEADFDLYGRSFWLRQGRLRPIPYFLTVIGLARAHGLPVVWYAQGLGPLHTRTARHAVAFIARNSQALTWRDRDSAELAAAIGARAPVEAVVPDPAYALEPASESRVDAALGRTSLRTEQGFLAVSLRPWLKRTAYLETVTTALSRIALETDREVLFLPFQPRQDLPLARGLAADPRWEGRAQVLEGVDDPRLLLGVLGRASLAVTMRLHAGILAAAAGTPAVSIAYDPKVTAFARQTGQEAELVDVDDLEAPGGARRLQAACRDTLTVLDTRRSRLERKVAGLRRETCLPAALAASIAGTV